MKNKTSYSLLLLAALLIWAGCKEPVYEFGEVPSKLEGINDSWELVEVVQVDKLTLSVDSTLEVTSMFLGGSPVKMTFNSTDFTYTLEAGSGPDFLGGSGSWSFDDNDFPSEIRLTTGGEVINLRMLRTVRPNDPTLEFQIGRGCGDSYSVGYNYKFVRSSN